MAREGDDKTTPGIRESEIEAPSRESSFAPKTLLVSANPETPEFCSSKGENS